MPPTAGNAMAAATTPAAAAAAVRRATLDKREPMTVYPPPRGNRVHPKPGHDVLQVKTWTLTDPEMLLPRGVFWGFAAKAAFDLVGTYGTAATRVT
ncbi:hypothetical protein GCM10009733_001520 [Nonomuraea maheshkhaliensis]|uniref:Uncharacterized protein n=1 Tax=Nonomuraea maheshkhaliensis TaxID=419590 RepID=A0ABN2EJK3_9ACTN